MARILLFISALTLASCGGGKASTDASHPVVTQIPLDLGATSTPPAASVAVPKPPAKQEKQEKVEARPAASGKTEAGVVALDAWHRRTATARGTSSEGGDAAQALAGLHQVLSGDGAAVQSRWRQAAPKGLGAEFSRLAGAFAQGGTTGLEQALIATPAVTPASLAFQEVLTVRALESQEIERAGRALSRLLAGATASGYPRERILEWGVSAQRVADGVSAVIPATAYVVAAGDSYWKICNNLRKKGQPIEPGWVKLFNRRRGDNIAKGETLRLPSLPLRIEAWRQLRLAAVFAGDFPVRIYATSSGKPESPTPLGEFTLKICEKEPVYYPPSAASVPYKNPQNPLGERWLGFAEDRQYGLHGTNSENTIGSFETGGCIRMHNADVIELFDLVGPGAKVRINP